MTLKDSLLNLVETVIDKYYDLKSVKFSLIQDFKGLFQQFNASFDRIAYQSSGITGIYQDLIKDQQNVITRINNIRDNTNNLENILFNKTKTVYQNFSTESSLNTGEKEPKKTKKFSRIKSAILSTVAGVGTTIWLYKKMRNTPKNSVEDIVDNSYDFSKEFTPKYTPENLNTILALKDKYFWKNFSQLQDIVEKESGLILADVGSVVKEAMMLKTTNPIYSDVARINYDSRISSQEMKSEILHAYISSDKTLKEISTDLEKKYGMYASSSTISRNARKCLETQGLSFKNRRETKRYYLNTAAAN